NDEGKLEEIKVLIDEPALVPGFKYVSEQIHNDQALYLMYKMRRSLEAAASHGIVDVEEQLKRVESIIEGLWMERGLYPGLGAAVALLEALADGDPSTADQARGERLVVAIRE